MAYKLSDLKEPVPSFGRETESTPVPTLSPSVQAERARLLGLTEGLLYESPRYQRARAETLRLALSEVEMQQAQEPTQADPVKPRVTTPAEIEPLLGNFTD